MTKWHDLDCTLMYYWFAKGRKKILSKETLYQNGILLLVLTQMDTACMKSLLLLDQDLVAVTILQWYNKNKVTQKTYQNK